MIDGAATLQELETVWNLDDVARANAVLDMRLATQSAAVEDARREAQRKQK